MNTYSLDPAYAKRQDEEDVLKEFRNHFFIPRDSTGREVLYFSGNSLGLQPCLAAHYVIEELEKWKQHAVLGHTLEPHPWVSYQTLLTDKQAHLLGALPSEIAVMNSLTVNLHLMMVSFYRPTALRHKILINPKIFPSDYFALCSEVAFHGFDPETSLIKLPADEDGLVDPAAIAAILRDEGESIALVWLEGVSYYTGQAFDIKHISAEAHRYGCKVGIDLAHSVGNCELNLHADGVDFAVWCSYKYLNGGPGCVGGCFVHQKYHHESDLPRFAGWWGQALKSRFKMDAKFEPIPGAEGWQLSNLPILAMASLRASLEIFALARMARLRAKSLHLTGYLEFLLARLENSNFRVITPKNPTQRGCQLSVRVEKDAEALLLRLKEAGCICDYRPPHVIRIAPTPLYNTFADVYALYLLLKKEGEM